ncbi:MAG: TetR/AcrR family transcriptional regulator [Vicinamibacterales bacterium]
MPRPRFARLPAEKRNRILEVAAVEFASQGFAGASLNRIIERSGISKGAAYYYFDDKADLFAAVLRHAWTSMRVTTPMAVGALTRETFWPALRAGYEALLDRLRAQPWLVAVGKLVYGPLPTDEVAAVVGEEFDLARRLLGAIVDRGQQVGAIRRDVPADLLGAMLIGALEAADRWAVDHLDLPADAATSVSGPAVQVFDRIFDLLRDLAEPPGRAA